MALKKYNTNIKNKAPKKEDPEPSGIACDEKDCEGEMMITNPKEHHPELHNMLRAVCGVCGWRGWV